MSQPIFPKSIISSEAIVIFLSKNPDFLITESDEEWFISSIDANSPIDVSTTRSELIELELRLSLEDKVTTIRNILYTKTFAPIHHD